MPAAGRVEFGDSNAEMAAVRHHSSPGASPWKSLPHGEARGPAAFLVWAATP